MLCRPGTTVNSPAFAHNLENGLGVTQALRIAQQEITSVAQGKMQQGERPALCLRLEINQQIAASDDIHAGKRWVAQQVLRGKNHLVTQCLLDTVSVLVLLEKSLEPFGRQVAFYAAGIDAGAGKGQWLIRRIGGKYFDIDFLACPLGLLCEEHGERVGLLAARTGTHPGPDRIATLVLCDHGSYDGLAQCIPRSGIAKKSRNVDHQVVGERL